MGAGTQTQPSTGTGPSRVLPTASLPVPDIPKSCGFNLTATKISSHFANVRSFWNLPFSGRARGGLWAGAEAWPAGTAPGPVFLGSGSTTHPSPVGAGPVQALGEKRGGPLQPWANKLGAADRSVKPGCSGRQGTDLGDPAPSPPRDPSPSPEAEFVPQKHGGWGKGWTRTTPHHGDHQRSQVYASWAQPPCPVHSCLLHGDRLGP